MYDKSHINVAVMLIVHDCINNVNANRKIYYDYEPKSQITRSQCEYTDANISSAGTITLLLSSILLLIMIMMVTTKIER